MFHLLLISKVFVVVVLLYYHLVVNEFLFIPLIDTAALLIFRNFPQNLYDFLVLALEQNSRDFHFAGFG